MSTFENQIEAFNKMYGLPAPSFPTARAEIAHEKSRLNTLTVIEDRHIPDKQAVISRLRAFKDILQEELVEVDDIIVNLSNGVREDNHTPYTELEFLVDLADWLGDIQIYCASEMLRYGLPNQAILDIIMVSNFSKLGPDSQPIYDDRGKVLKGPNYWKPEPLIKSLLGKFLAENKDIENKESKE